MINFQEILDELRRSYDMRIIGIEGSSFAGKTTLAHNLGQQLNAPVIEEYVSYAQPEGFPNFAVSSNDLERQIQYYASLEAKRAIDLNGIGSSVEFVIVDRTAASLIAFQKTMSKDSSGYDFFWDADTMRKTLFEQSQKGLVIAPDVVVLLSAGSRAEHNRRVLSRGSISTITSLNDWNFSEKIRLETRRSLHALGSMAILERISSDDPDAIIDNINGLGS